MSRESDHTVKDVWENGGAYESFIGRWSRPVALEFLKWISIPAGKSWLDVGCGTGVLCKTILDVAAPTRVKGIDQAPGFISFAKKHIPDPRAAFEAGSADSLTAEPRTYDVVVSGLVLNFIPEPERAVSEMQRVAERGGVVGAYVWDYAGKMQVLRHFWDAAVAHDPHAAVLDEGKRFPLCNPDRLRGLFSHSGIDSVDVRAIDIEAHFVDFEDYWSPFLSGQGPAPSYVASLTREQQSQLGEEVRARLPISADGTIDLIARAWAVRGYA